MDGYARSTHEGTSPRAGSVNDEIQQQRRSNDPFTSPYGSIPASASGSTTGFQHGGGPNAGQSYFGGGAVTEVTGTDYQIGQPHPDIHQPRWFRSRRITERNAEKPWLTGKKDPREKWTTIIPCIGFLAGVGLLAFLVYDGYSSVENHTYCPVYASDFASNGLEDNIWTKEVQVGGFGNGEFEMTTNTDENVYIQDGVLIIKPTLQDEDLVERNNTIDLTEDGTCTSDRFEACVAVTNVNNGTIVPPVKSGRINTIRGATITYGRVEVEARLPSGDWMWPAIWMLPVNNTYGDWPQSGEIDIMESRGNNYTYSAGGGNNDYSSTIHWGADQENDGWWRSLSIRSALHTTFAAQWHTFGLEWSSNYIFSYLDNRLAQVMYVPFDGPLWPRGNFPPADSNGTRLADPWSQTGRYSTPFDMPFYLIINVAVGGTNGWFADGVAGKPWVDTSPLAPLNFWQARDQWYPTWQDKGYMEVRNVRIWQQSGFEGCTEENAVSVGGSVGG